MVESEQDRLDMLEDWGANITLPGGAVVKGIVDRDFAALQFGVSSSDPMALVSTAQVDGVLVYKSSITVSSSGITGVDGDYEVIEQQPDGSGMTVLKLGQV